MMSRRLERERGIRRLAPAVDGRTDNRTDTQLAAVRAKDVGRGCRPPPDGSSGTTSQTAIGVPF